MEVFGRPVTIFALVAHFFLIGIVMLFPALSFLFGVGIGIVCGHYCLMLKKILPYIGFFSILIGLSIYMKKSWAVKTTFIVYQCLLTFFLIRLVIEIIRNFIYTYYSNLYIYIYLYFVVYFFVVIMMSHAMSKDQFFIR